MDVSDFRNALPERFRPAVDGFQWLFRPTWTTFALASVATLWMAAVRWRVWTTGGQYAWSEHHFYWPAYTWSHTDGVVGPFAPALLGDFLYGVLRWYVPAALCAAVLRVAFVRLVGREPLSAWLVDVADFLAMRPLRVLKTLAFALVASFLPPMAVSLFTLPGLLLLVFLPVGTLPPPFPEAHSGFYVYWTVPLSLVSWYVLLRAGGEGVRRFRVAVAGGIVEN